jgi:carbon-monoxide dehydrogenase medium subunit
MNPFDYSEPASIGEAIDLLRMYGDEGHPVAGGTALVLLLKQDLLLPRLLVGLGRIEELQGIRTGADGGLEIGATTSHRAVEIAPAVRTYAPALADAFRRIGTIRVRTQGTLGGNLAHADPAQDPPPILMALDAAVVVVGATGERTIPLSSFFVDYFETVLATGELIKSVHLPPRDAGAHATYVKFLPRTHDDYATVGVAVSASRHEDGRWRHVRIGVGAAGPVPIRATGAETALEGTAFDALEISGAADLVAEAVDPIDDLRGSASYKRDMTRIWAGRALARLAGQAAATSDGP